MKRILSIAIVLMGPAMAADPPSVGDLEARCEAARQAKLQPLREQEIANCKAEARNDPAYCERFYKDFGEGGRNLNGAPIPRKFDDLPECVAAREARRNSTRR